VPQPNRLRLIPADQLNERHSWFQKTQDNVTYVLMEVRQETDYVKYHIQKATSFWRDHQGRAQTCNSTDERIEKIMQK